MNIKPVIYTLCFVSIALNVGLVTKYVQIGSNTSLCVPIVDEPKFDGVKQ